MNFFCGLSSAGVAELVRSARRRVCYAAPGLHDEPAAAIVEAADRLGADSVVVCLDLDESVLRMGYGTLDGVARLRNRGLVVNHAPGLRRGLLVVDDEGFVFTPTPLYLEAELPEAVAQNAVRLTGAQVTEALARLSPAARELAVTQANDAGEAKRLSALPSEIRTAPVTADRFDEVAGRIKEAPPVRFDIARQVRVFEPYLQYVELKLSGAAIQRHRVRIPESVQSLGASPELEGRLQTTFRLIEENSRISSEPLDEALDKIRKNLTRSLGKDHGRVVLKSAKLVLEERLTELRALLEKHKAAVEKNLQRDLDRSKKQVVEHYVPLVQRNPPDAMVGQLFMQGKPNAAQARHWLNGELDPVFPKAADLVQGMALEVRYKDVTFETLNQKDFLTLVREAFPHVDWERPYEQFRAAGEAAEARPVDRLAN